MLRVKYLTFHLIPVFAALLVYLILLPAVSARHAQNVSLVYFRGQGLDNAARLEWRTVSEDNTAGYKIERAGSEDGPFTFLSDIGIIEARGSVSSGDSYEATDNTAENGQTYWYRLIEIEFDNSEHVLHTTDVLVAPPPTPEPVGGGSSDATSTPVATSTSPATSTSQAGGNNDDEDDTGDNDTPAASATSRNSGQGTNTPQATAASPTPRNRPTNTPPPPPTPMVSNPNNNDDDVAEAAGVTVEADVIAQVTPGTDPYPSPEDEEENSADAYPAPSTESANDIPAAPVEGYPAGSGGGNSGSSTVGDGRAVGSNDDATDSQEAQQEENSNASRILLWVGFIVALLVFAAGVVFAIMLSTRQRHNNP